jgi:hypothetical protein
MNPGTESITPTLGDIEGLCRRYADEHAALADIVSELQDEIDAAKRKRLRSIKAAVARTADARSKLATAVERAPGLFNKPKTLTLFGVKVGFRKAKGRIDYDAPAEVVKRIRKHFGGRFDDLVSIKETPLKSALAQLSGAELKKLGVTVESDTDEVVVQSTSDQVDKLVNALLAEAEDVEKAA